MDLFVSKYFNKIDKKGRVSLPSSFRNILPKINKNEIILYKSIKTPSIEGCGVGRLNEIAKRISFEEYAQAEEEREEAQVDSALREGRNKVIS